ncbi:MAG: hypothetical protein HY985_18535 [Magnetospirillum sp.]|nr:hypothetical protein [Magnetospirillum sp.]
MQTVLEVLGRLAILAGEAAEQVGDVAAALVAAPADDVVEERRGLGGGAIRGDGLRG